MGREIVEDKRCSETSPIDWLISVYSIKVSESWQTFLLKENNLASTVMKTASLLN